MSYTSDVISATSGRGEPNWDLIIKLCNRIRDSVGSVSMQQAMSSVLLRVKHSDPNIQLHALTLLEACVSNCGKDFQLELTKPSFQTEIKAILTGSYSDPRVTQRVKDLLVNWVNEFRNESNMSPLVRFVEQLKKDGISFPGLRQPTTAPSSGSAGLSGASPVLQAREDEELRKAIQLSLQESNAPGPTSSPLYPSIGTSAPSVAATSSAKSPVKKVRAIYDFVAAEDNELSFRAGEIINVLDSSDENWWRGETHLGKGLFPASFVSSDLSVDPEPSRVEKKEAKGAGKVKGSSAGGKAEKKVTVNEGQIDLLLDMIKTADVTSEENQAENATLMELEGECKKMRPIVEESISALQRQEDEMQAVSDKFQEALQLYRKLLSEGPRLSASVPPAVAQPSPVAQPPSVPNTTKQAEASQPPPYAHHTYHHAPPPTSGGVMITPPQQSLYAAGSSLHHPQSLQQPPPPPAPTQHSMAALSSSPRSWTGHTPQPMGQPSSLSAYSANPLQQQSISMPPQSLTAHQPNYSISGAPPMGSMATQAPVPPPYQPASLYQPQQTLVQQPLL